MQRNKMIFVYGLIMLACVALIVVVGLVTGPAVSSDSGEGQNAIDEKQNSIRILEEKVAALEKDMEKITAERDALAEENENLRETLQLDSSESDYVTMEQAMADLKDIYEIYKSGNVSKARSEFAKIEPMGFDDATLAYYELLKDVLE